MDSVRVAVVSRDPDVRLAAARAFDAAPASWAVELHPAPHPEADVVVFGPDSPGPGIAFDPERPERVIEEVRAAAVSARSRVVVVTSPSGGTGVTTLALHLAQTCAAARRTTCFVDLDVRWGARDRLGLNGETRTWAELDGAEDESLMLCALPMAGGFRALLAPRADGDVRPPGGVEEMLRRVAARFERVIVDAPDGIFLGDALSCTRAAVAVIAPTLPAAARARDFLVRYDRTAWAVVTNRMGPGGEARRARLEHVMERRIAVELPCTPALRDAEDEGRLLTASWSRWPRAVGRLRAALEAS